jgi:hypothetical protein
MLLRVKTDTEADELLAKLNEAKKWSTWVSHA